jgi:hypothetical protein
VQRTLALAVLAAILSGAAPGANDRVDRRVPGTTVQSWAVRWPDPGRHRVITKRFTAPPGLIRRVRVLVGGIAVPGPPHLAVIPCSGTGELAGAQKAWVWDGSHVHVLLLLDPGRCGIAGKVTPVRVFLTTVGT